VIDYAPIVLFALDREGNITLSEGKGLEALGLKPDQMIGQSIFDLYADSTQILESVHAALANEAGTSTIEVDGLTFDIWYEPLCNQNKQVVGVVGAALDVTWRKQAEQTLQQTNAKLQQRIHELGTLNRITQAVATVTDLQSALELVAQEITHCFNGFSTGISLFNEARTERTIVVLYQVQDQDKLDLVGRVIPITDGMTYTEYIGRGKPLVIPDPQTSPYTRASHKSIQERNLQCLMLIPLQSRGEIIGTISVSTNQVGREFISTEVRLAETIAGQIAGAIENARLYTAAQQEIAERKRAQEALAQARDQALEASRLKSELLAKVSHELRTPLGVILGYAELLEDGTFGSLSEQQQEITVKVIDSARYLSNLVNELLDQAQFERGKLELAIKPFAPKDLIRQVETKMNVLAQAKGLSLSHDIAVHVPPILSGDPYRLQQVLVNLVSNAIKFTDTGEVTVRFSCPDPEHWAMQVTDTGSGIPPEAQAYIFEPFRQVDGSMTREHSGTGLGLSIVKQLTTLMGGQVTLESQLGQGSTFTILLPLTPIQEKKV
jgi:PAS domain S-box-containing protein